MPDLILVEGGEVKMIDLDPEMPDLIRAEPPKKAKKKKRRRITKKNVKRRKKVEAMEEVVDMTKEAVGFSFEEEVKEFEEEGKKQTVARLAKAKDFLNTIKENVSTQKTSHKSITKPKKNIRVLSPQLRRVLCVGKPRV